MIKPAVCLYPALGSLLDAWQAWLEQMSWYLVPELATLGPDTPQLDSLFICIYYTPVMFAGYTLWVISFSWGVGHTAGDMGAKETAGKFIRLQYLMRTIR